jgi:mycofactocin precursor
MDELTTAPVQQTDENAPPAEPVATEVLVEEVSIDGMCGVY